MEVPDDVLVSILERLGDYKNIARSCPLVCKRWNGVCSKQLSTIELDCFQVGYGVDSLLARVVGSNRERVKTLRIYSSERECSRDLFPRAKTTNQLVRQVKNTLESLDISGNTTVAEVGRLWIDKNSEVNSNFMGNIFQCQHLSKIRLASFRIIPSSVLASATPLYSLEDLSLSNVVLNDKQLEDFLVLCPSIKQLHIDCKGLVSPNLKLPLVTTLSLGTVGRLVVTTPSLRRLRFVNASATVRLVNSYQIGDTSVEVHGVAELEEVELVQAAKLESKGLLWVERLKTPDLKRIGGTGFGVRALEINTGLLDGTLDLSPFSDSLEELKAPLRHDKLEVLFTGVLPRLKKAFLRIVPQTGGKDVELLGIWMQEFKKRCQVITEIEFSMRICGGEDVEVVKQKYESVLGRNLQDTNLTLTCKPIEFSLGYARHRDRSRSRYEL